MNIPILKSQKDFDYTAKDNSMFEKYLYTLKRGGNVITNEDFQIIRGNDYGYHLFHYVYEGNGLLLVDNQEYMLKAGDMFILSSGEPHVYASNDNHKLGLLWIEFCGSNSTNLMNTIKKNHLRVVSKPTSDELMNIINEIVLYVKNHDNLDNFHISKLLYNLLCTTIQISISSKSIEHIYPLYIEKAISYVKSNIYDTITVNHLANYVGYSVSYFTKTFSKSVGVTPSQYIMMKKIEEARKLLSLNNPTCEELAECLGFYDATHFVKMYKKYTGHTPKRLK